MKTTLEKTKCRYRTGHGEDRLLELGASEIVRKLERHFRDNYPILLDGAQPMAADQGRFVRQARESLARGRGHPDQLPAAVLRDALENLAATPRPATAAGLTAVGPRHARVWWDDSLTENVTDILASLDSPRLLLRFYDVTGLGPDAGRWHEVIEVDTRLEERGRTLELLNPGRVFVVELGYTYSDGRFLCLARTNAAALPREGGVEPAEEMETVLSNLRPRSPMVDGAIFPDAAAREWVAARPDHAARDLEAEYLIHMLYRAFLREGPRALRRASRPVRRDADVLRREYAQRERSRVRRAAPKRAGKEAPAVLVTRLDRAGEVVRLPIAHPPVPLSPSSGLLTAAGCGLTTREYSLLQAAVQHARTGPVWRVGAPSPELSPATTAPKTAELVRPVSADADLPSVLMAAPVFEAARKLRDRLAGIAPVPHSEPTTPEKTPSRPRTFGGAEARRLAKAGVRVTRMALTIEGRMRPGARLKVAGKLIHADAEGRFTVECVLGGRKAAIPLRAGTSVGGEARSRINVEWEKRPSREKRRV